MARVDGTVDRSETTADWAWWLEGVGFEQGQVDPAELPGGMTVVDSMAAGAWRFAERMAFIGADGLADAGRRVAGLATLDCDQRQALAPVFDRRSR